MQLSHSLSPILKRFAWLWGALLGVVLLPVLMTACYYVASICFPPPTAGTAPFSNPSFLLHGLFTRMRHFGVWDAGLGCCGAMLWYGYRSLKWRALSFFAAVGTMGALWGEARRYWPVHHTLFALWDQWEKWTRYMATTACVPLALGALLLVFFALLLRAPRPLAT